GIERRRLGREVGIELLALLLDRRHGFLRTRDILGFLHGATDAASGGRRAANRAGRNGLASQQRADDGGAQRDRRLNSLTGGLLAFPLDRLIRSAKFFVERRLTRRVLASELVHRAVAILTRPVRDSGAELALRFVGT